MVEQDYSMLSTQGNVDYSGFGLAMSFFFNPLLLREGPTKEDITEEDRRSISELTEKVINSSSERIIDYLKSTAEDPKHIRISDVSVTGGRKSVFQCNYGYEGETVPLDVRVMIVPCFYDGWAYKNGSLSKIWILSRTKGDLDFSSEDILPFFSRIENLSLGLGRIVQKEASESIVGYDEKDFSYIFRSGNLKGSGFSKEDFINWFLYISHKSEEKPGMDSFEKFIQIVKDMVILSNPVLYDQMFSETRDKEKVLDVDLLANDFASNIKPGWYLDESGPKVVKSSSSVGHPNVGVSIISYSELDSDYKMKQLLVNSDLVL